MNPYTFHITLYDLAFLGTIFIGLTFTLLLGFTKRANQSANRFLALALAVMVLWMVRISAIDIRLPLQFSLALGPLIFFYVLKLTRPDYKFRRKDLLHFIPVLLEQVILPNPVLQLLVFVSVIIYLYLSHRLIERFYRRLKFNGGDRYRSELRWLHRLLVGFGLLWLLWIPYTAVDYFYYHNQSGVTAYYPFYLCLAVMLIWIAVAAHLRPEINVTADTFAFLKLPLPKELKQKGAWLKNVVKANLYYQDPELSLSSLAEKLDLHPHELSRIINVALKKNFNDFINEYRVRDVASKMQDPAYDRITLLGMAFDAGFNSKATFIRAFKQLTGKNPAEYKRDLEKEVSTYHLQPYSRSLAIISFHDTTPVWSPDKLNRNIMFKNYLKIAFRSFWKHKVFTLINIIGLSIGISASLVIYLIVHYDFTFDKFHKDGDRIYRVVSNFKFQGNLSHSYGVTTPMTAGIRNNIAGVEVIAPLYTLNPDVMVTGKHSAPRKV